MKSMAGNGFGLLPGFCVSSAQRGTWLIKLITIYNENILLNGRTITKVAGEQMIIASTSRPPGSKPDVSC